MNGRPTQKVSVARHSGGPTEVDGWLVTPGLAIAPSLTESNYFTLTHLPTGLALITSRCAEHIETAAQMVTRAAPIDWTRGKDELVADQAVISLGNEIVKAIGFCYDCGREPAYDGPSWSVRCNTCHWQWEDEPGEGPLDAAEAKRVANDHECEPDVEIAPPGDGNEWFPEWLVNSDGTVGRARKAGVA